MGLLNSLFAPKPQVYPTPVTDDTFAELVLKSDKPVLLDFTSASCAPCQKLKPVLLAVQTKYPDDLTVVTAEVAANSKAAARLKVRSTPTLILFRGGRELGRVSGFRPRSYWEGMIEQELLGGG